MDIGKALRAAMLICAISVLAAPNLVPAQALTKAQVSEKIKQVEGATDDFKEYLDRKGENARSRASSPESQERRLRRSESVGEPTEAQKARIQSGANELEDAVEDLENATDRLRRRFRRVQNYLDTRNQVEKVVEEGRRINQLVVRGNYGAEAARVWAVLRTAINDLARIYRVTPMSV